MTCITTDGPAPTEPPATPSPAPIFDCFLNPSHPLCQALATSPPDYADVAAPSVRDIRSVPLEDPSSPGFVLQFDLQPGSTPSGPEVAVSYLIYDATYVNAATGNWRIAWETVVECADLEAMPFPEVVSCMRSPLVSPGETWDWERAVDGLTFSTPYHLCAVAQDASAAGTTSYAGSGEMMCVVVQTDPDPASLTPPPTSAPVPTPTTTPQAAPRPQVCFRPTAPRSMHERDEACRRALLKD